MFSKHDSKTNDSQDQFLRRTEMLYEDRQRHNRAARLAPEMRTLEVISQPPPPPISVWGTSPVLWCVQANEHGIVGECRAIDAGKPLTKLDRTQRQCGLLSRQAMQRADTTLEQHGGTAAPLWKKLPPLPNSASKWPRYVGPMHKHRCQLLKVKKKQSNFKKLVQRRRYKTVAEKSTRYRDRNQNYVALGACVNINDKSALPSGRNRKSVAQRIRESKRRLQERQPAFRDRSRGQRRRACPPGQRND
jgi:hypothetical protein